MRCVCVSPFVQWYPIKDGRTPLSIAAQGDHLKVVKCLLTEAKVDPNQPDKVLSGAYDVCGRDVCVPRVSGVHTCICTHCLVIMHKASACVHACVRMCE